MTGKGGISTKPTQRLRAVLFAQVLWLACVCALGVWWGRLVLRQSATIQELEAQLGVAVSLAHDHFVRTQRMLFWESLTYFILLLASTAVLFWVYWRDLRRTRALQTFFASLTHELRTPLTSIRLQAESISENLGADSSQRHLVERLLQDTLRMESQVERSLELARLEGGGPVFAQALQLKPWVERVIQGWKESYGPRVQFDLSLSEHLILADSGALQVILKNLVENATKHSKQDSVRMEIRSENVGADSVMLRVKDNGSGFQGDSGRLGQLFEKGPGSNGAGVGLYLVQTLMTRMGGTARFSGGAGFEVLLCFRQGGANG